jgi:hypothetical protein
VDAHAAVRRAVRALTIAATRPGVRRALRVGSVAAALAALAFLGARLAESWSELGERLLAFDPAPFALGVALIMLQTVLIAAIWRDLLRLLGGRVGLASAYRLIFLAALGKYLPGKLWALGGVAAMAPAAGVPMAAATLASTGTVGLVAVGGALVGGLTYSLWRLSVAPALVLAAAGALALAPWLASGALGSPRSRLALRALAAANGSWLLLALANWSIARAIWPVGLDLAPPILASAALGWAAGLAAVAVPAGLGVREAVQALALADVLPPTTAAAFALLVRVALIVADLLAAGAALALRPTPAAVESCAPLPHH